MTAAVVTITPVVPPGASVSIPLAGTPSAIGLGGGWVETKRPRNTALTEWQGWPLATLAIPFLIDHFATGDSAEFEMAYLENLIRDVRGGVQPPVVALAGPIAGTFLRWVLQSIDYGDEVRRVSDGARVRIAGTLNFLEYNEPDLLVSTVPTPAASAVERATSSTTTTGTSPSTAPAPTTGRTYTVKSGDSLSKIAQQQLGNANRWQEIATLNGIRDPRSIKPGQVLRLP